VSTWVKRIFFVLIFSLGFAQPAILIGGLRSSGTDLIYVFTGFALIGLLITRSERLRFDRSFLFLIIYGFALILSTIFSLSVDRSLLKLVGELFLISIPILVVHFVSNRDFLRSTACVWIGASTIVAILSFVTVVLFYLDRSSSWHSLFLHHYGSLPSGNYPRIQSTFFYPAMLASYLNVSINILFGAWMTGWIRNRLFALLIALHLFALVFTFTPGLGGTVLSVGIWIAVVLSKRGHVLRSRVTTVGAVIGALCFVVVSAISFWPIATSPFTFDAFGYRLDPTQRLLTWLGAFETFLQYPLFGKGVGLPVASVYFAPPSGGMQILTDAHNSFLSVAAQAGMIGIASFLGLIIHVVRRGWTSAESLDWIRFSLLLAFVSGFIYEGLVGSFENARHLWVLIGLVIAASRSAETDTSN
jgi:O-antigen ligase